jgi:GntR family transcriptional regulator, transcriptional repressor for pyruvate dehydrogenase complex
MMPDGGAKPQGRLQKRQLVQVTADRLRDLVFAQEPGTQIGSLPELAALLGVGIVTVQQAARILEHEGLLDVRRGPGGGYYGMRPDETALERLLAAYLRTHASAYGEVLDITTLLFRELVAAAADCADEELREGLRAFLGRIDECRNESDIGAFEAAFQEQLFRMVNRPLFELLTRVALNLYAMRPNPPLFADSEGVRAWHGSRHRIIGAILDRDSELARFEANRARRDLLERLRHQLAQPGVVTSA